MRKDANTNRKLLLGHDFFYHAACAERVERICQQRLLAAPHVRDLYVPYFGAKLPVFLCARQHVDRAVDTVQSKYSKVAVQRVPGRVVEDLQRDVDLLFPDLMKGLSFQDCIAQVGYFACRNAIYAENREQVHIKKETNANTID